MHPGLFRTCLREWIDNDRVGRSYTSDIKFDSDGKRLNGFKLRIDIYKLKSIAHEGVELLRDLRRIEDEFQVNETVSYFKRFMEIEKYFVFMDELITGLVYSMIAVFFVVLFVTVNLRLTFLVLVSVVLVDYYLVALLYFWGLTLNMFTGAHMIFAVGMAVDYSTHIAHAYLLAEPPATCLTNT